MNVLFSCSLFRWFMAAFRTNGYSRALLPATTNELVNMKTKSLISSLSAPTVAKILPVYCASRLSWRRLILTFVNLSTIAGQSV